MSRYVIDLGMKAPPASSPPEIRGRNREDVKLLTIDRRSGIFRHHSVGDLKRLLHPEDILVVNNSKAIPASLPVIYGDQPGIAHLAARLSPHHGIIERRTAGGAPDWSNLPTDTSVTIQDSKGHLISTGLVTGHFHPRSRFWSVATDRDWYEIAQRIGVPIRYHYVANPYPIERYQTIFGHVPGSSEMPSASRPFTQELVNRLHERGVTIVPLTLHTTVSSHEISDTNPDFPILPEWFSIPETTQKIVLQAHHEKRPIIALGTTVARALETWAYTTHTSGWTTHLITPNTAPRLTKGLITGLHDSFTSHLLLLYAFLDPNHLRTAYHAAGQAGYLWHEFGDLSLIR